MNKIEEQLDKAYESIKDRLTFTPEAAVILGSGLGAFADLLTDKTYIPYNEIEGFPVSTVAGHAGTFVAGRLGNTKVLVMKGRVHYYEGYSMDQVVMPVRLMHRLGVNKIILTNAAGGVNYDFEPGNLMLITDQITSFVPSPLIGENIESLGTRFPDMSHVYNVELSNRMREIAHELSIPLKEGVYLQTTGPAYETPAEIKMFRTLGADAVGMSTTCEAMACAHMGMEVVGVSCITNMAAGMLEKPLNHKEVGETAAKAASDFTRLIKTFIERLK